MSVLGTSTFLALSSSLTTNSPTPSWYSVSNTHQVTWATGLAPHLPWVGNTSRITESDIEVRPTGTQGTGYWPTQATSGAPQSTATVIVGNAGNLSFSPSSLEASIGTVVSFIFLGLNHTLTQSSFLHPCQKIDNGIDSGFNQFNPANASGRFLVNYEVTNDNAQWFFCAQTIQRAHCQAGMVFSLNPHGLHSQFVANALAAVTGTVSASSTSSLRICNTPLNPSNASLSNLVTATGSGRNRVSATPTLPDFLSSGTKAICASDSSFIWALVLVVWLWRCSR